MKKLRFVIGAAVFIGIASLYRFYRQARQEVILKLRAGSLIADIPHGPLEYAVGGSGPAILVLHGAGSGYEQGLMLAKLIDTGKFSLIGLSRPGYRQTPLATGQTPEQQADAACELLDRLNIQKAAILGISAGGLSAAQLALRHPERCLALILVSADMPPTQNERVSRSVLVGLGFQARMPDFLLWLLFAPFRNGAVLIDTSSTGGPALVTDPEAAAILREMVFSMWPPNDLRAGILNDIEQIQALRSYPLEKIQVPTLIIHGRQDAVVPIGLAEHAARTIPGAQSLFIPGGSHQVTATHAQQVGQRIQQFLGDHDG